jgi:DNA/RNA endonuclease YhcR with UshA esterase domain
MKFNRQLITTLVASGLFASVCVAGDKAKVIRASEAAQHIGEFVTVNAVVADTAYLPKSNGQPTFLNLDQPFPDSPLAVAIWGENRSKWSNPPDQWFKDKTVAVTGKVTLWHGKPQLVVNDPSQIEVVTRTSSSAASTVAASR